MEDQSIILQEGNETPDRVFDLKCVVCGVKTGEYVLPPSVPEDYDVSTLTLADLGFADVRCEACTDTHGSFQQGEQEFIAMGGDALDFPAAVVAAAGDVKQVISDTTIAYVAEVDQRVTDEKKGTKAPEAEVAE